jgi:hypothetical protein
MSAPDTSKAWLAANPPPDSAFVQSLAHVAARLREGEDLRFAVREFLDEFELLPRRELMQRAIDERPTLTGEAPADAEPERFLDRFWFLSEVPGFRALAIAQSPAAFRRRGIFIAEGALQRV